MSKAARYLHYLRLVRLSRNGFEPDRRLCEVRPAKVVVASPLQPVLGPWPQVLQRDFELLASDLVLRMRGTVPMHELLVHPFMLVAPQQRRRCTVQPAPALWLRASSLRLEAAQVLHLVNKIAPGDIRQALACLGMLFAAASGPRKRINVRATLVMRDPLSKGNLSITRPLRSVSGSASGRWGKQGL
eukprot:CAMPEP_0171122216 /NCGR_PEP_ID=MMETSP0766_2-20121228/104541_1 /TAXON_ID=439317 /ORGANISM="Gambierdiscus australes, Strain CAWD 149" /LENGTH=186 /DNA_ID=CAMNT_0011585045 /DNA_START=14 /DNA_END=571 /DNA_ORIENTATION=+